MAPERTAAGNANLAFFEAYFSNFIEGTEFSVEEAEDIVFRGVIPQERPEDAHDILGTYRVVSDMGEMTTLPAGFEEFLELLRRRHAAILDGRPHKNPGALQTKADRAGHPLFFAPDLVTVPLKRVL